MKKSFSRGALILTNMDGEKVPFLVNLDSVKNTTHKMAANSKTRKGGLGNNGHPIRAILIVVYLLYFSLFLQLYHLGVNSLYKSLFTCESSLIK